MEQEIIYNLYEFDLSRLKELKGVAKELLAHYDKYLNGNLIRAYKIDNLPSNIPAPFYILLYNVQFLESPGFMYATIGGSFTNYPYPASWTKERKARLGEYITYSRSFETDILKVFVQLLIYPFRTNSFFDLNHTLAFPDGQGLIENSKLTAAVFTYPFFETRVRELKDVFYKDGTFSPILWFVPVSLEERQFFRQHGPLDLFKLMDKESVDLSDWQRPSVVQDDQFGKNTPC